MNERRISRDPVWLARELRKDFSMSNEKPVDLNSIIKNMNIHYKEVSMPDGYLGASKTVGIRKGIIVSNQIDDHGRKRFTVAHELGHIFLHQGSHLCRKGYFGLAFNGISKESEANKFASELLMPGVVLREFSQDKDVTVKLAMQVSQTYETSLQAALMGLIKASPDIVCACCYTKEKFLWQIKSEACTSELRTRIKWPDIAGTGVHKVNPENWFIDDDFPDDISCSEENYIYPRGSHCISIITLESEEW
jgi:Zn-dependent peptidase ImmA (M78 family)